MRSSVGLLGGALFEGTVRSAVTDWRAPEGVEDECGERLLAV